MPSGDLLILSVEQKITQTNKPYLSLKVRRTNDCPDPKEIDAKIWSEKMDPTQTLEPDRVVTAVYDEQQFNGQPQLTFSKYTLRPADFPKDTFLPPPAVDQERVYRKLYQLQNWVDPDIKALMESVHQLLTSNDNRLKKILLEIPAGSKNHHARRAGLLQHVNEMWDTALKILDKGGLPHFETLIHEELVLAGILLHDLGKIHEYNPANNQFEADRTGAYLGHSVWGGMLVLQLWPKEGNRETALRLAHIVFSHHGVYATGAAVPLKTAEANLVHLIDSMSARMDLFRTSEQMSAQGFTPNYSKMLGEVPITRNHPKQ